MKKILMLWTALTVMTVADAQSLKSSGRSAQEIVPQGWEINEATGDINKDGITDLMVIATPNFRENIQVRESDGYEYNYNQPVLAVYWGTADGQYKLYKKYAEIIPHQTDEFVFWDVSLSISEKGVITIGTSTFASAGSWSNNSDTFVFRWQQGDFYLIGYETQSMARNTGEDETISYNFLTHKKQVVTSNAFDENIPKRKKWTKIPAKPLKRLGSFHLEEYSFEE